MSVCWAYFTLEHVSFLMYIVQHIIQIHVLDELPDTINISAIENEQDHMSMQPNQGRIQRGFQGFHGTPLLKELLLLKIL